MDEEERIFRGVTYVDYELGGNKCCHILCKSEDSPYDLFGYAMIKLAICYDITSFLVVMTNFRYYDRASKKSHKYVVSIWRLSDTISDIELCHPDKNIRYYLKKCGGRKCKYEPTRNYQFNMLNDMSCEEFIIKFPKYYNAKEVMDNLSISYVAYLYTTNARRILRDLPDYVEPSVDL